MLDSIIGVALGQLGVPLLDFLEWGCDDFVNAVKYHRRLQDEKWEMVRWVGYYSVVGMVGSDKITIDKIKIPTDNFDNEPVKKAKWRKLQ